jgi:predicted dehydrogenase
MSNVRIGIVGLGNMGASHASSILAGKIPRLELTAVSDFDPARCTRGVLMPNRLAASSASRPPRSAGTRVAGGGT